MGRENKRPVIIGAGQHLHRPRDLSEAVWPLDLIETAVKRAEEDAGLEGLSEKIDSLSLVNVLSLPGEDPVLQLASKIGAHPGHTAYTWVGASAPQWLVNRTAERILSGRTKLALICGGESFCSKKMKTKDKAGAGRPGEEFAAKLPGMVGDLRDPLTPLEMNYGLFAPIHVYPLFENALRHHQGLTIEEHRQELGEFCERFSAMAVDNPYAWFRDGKTSEEIISLTKANRMISFPYTKYMCAIMMVDQAAALFMTDEETADELGVPEEKRAYLLGSGDAWDVWHVSQRIDFHASPSVRVAAQKALEQGGVSLEEIDHFDFYSCFPCAPRITRNMLGLEQDDPRPLTVTGGLPYFGGPGNNYALHAIARMVELLREDPGRTGMVQALSWFISKHSVGIYSGRPGTKTRPPTAPETYQKDLDKLERPDLVEEAEGRAMVETFTMFHDREGRPVKAVIIGRLESGPRFLAWAPEDEEVLTAMTREESVGRKGRVRSRDGFNHFEF